jgi:hypothetical protein
MEEVFADVFDQGTVLFYRPSTEANITWSKLADKPKVWYHSTVKPKGKKNNFQR